MMDWGSIKEEFLSEKHKAKIEEFQCLDDKDEKTVEEYLKEQSLNLMERNLARTRVFLDSDENIIGFYSMFNDTIKMHKQKRMEMDIRLPAGVNIIPAIRLHYIGVDCRYRGQGVGTYMMASVLSNCTEVAKNTGCTLITIESTKSAQSFYKRFDFKYICRDNGYYLMVYNTKSLIYLP